MLLAWLLSALIAWHRTWKEEPIMRHRKAEVESDEMNGASHLQRKAVR
ncbi:MAG: hypothetical protein J6575_00360 [Bifidobacterium sp.]|nr:hypothetical protein [Bifidobacterium sp.]